VASGGDDEELLAARAVRRDARAAVVAADVTIAAECDGRLEKFPSGASGDAGAGVHRFGAARVLRDLLVARAIKAAEASPAPVEGVLRGDEWVEKRTRRGTIQIPQKALWVPSSEAGDDPGFGPVAAAGLGAPGQRGDGGGEAGA
jgi:hypothetical protein